MAGILFLLSPVFFGGLCLLVGETVHWLKRDDRGESFRTTKVLTHAGRK